MRVIRVPIWTTTIKRGFIRLVEFRLSAESLREIGIRYEGNTKSDRIGPSFRKGGITRFQSEPTGGDNVAIPSGAEFLRADTFGGSMGNILGSYLRDVGIGEAEAVQFA